VHFHGKRDSIPIRFRCCRLELAFSAIASSVAPRSPILPTAGPRERKERRNASLARLTTRSIAGAPGLASRRAEGGRERERRKKERQKERT
jgi:hypothetical protein